MMSHMSGWLPVGMWDMSTSQSLSPVSSLICDPYKEIIWQGSQDGALASFHAGTLRSRVRVSTTNPVLNIHPLIHHIIAISDKMKVYKRGGLLQATMDTSSMHSLTGSYLSDDMYHSHQMYIAGEGVIHSQETTDVNTGCVLNVLDLLTDQMILQTPTDHLLSTLSFGRGIFSCGSYESPIVSLYDPRTLYTVNSLSHHDIGGVNKIHMTNDRLILSGYSVGQDSHGMSRYDSMLKIYDLRTMRPLTPVLFPLGGIMDFCFLPNFSSTLAVCAPSGLWQILDAETPIPDTQNFYTMDHKDPRTIITAINISSTGNLIYFGDSSGIVHCWSDKTQDVNDVSEITMNSYSAPVDYVPTHVPPPLHMNEHTPLDVMPLPPFTDPSTLLSSLPPNNPTPSSLYYNPPSIPPLDVSHFGANIRYQDFVGYVAWKRLEGEEKKHKIKEEEEDEDNEKNNNKHREGFIPNDINTFIKYSGKGRLIDKLRRKKTLVRYNELLNSPMRKELLISKEYARVTIKIPRLGLYAFDFSSYNKTNFTGLDNLLPNSYCNPVLQLLYFIPVLRNHFVYHLCERENCLSCELGFLFHMLDNAKGATAEPRNFLRALRTNAEAGGLGLLDVHELSSSSSELVLANKIQDFIRFLLEQLNKEQKETPQYQMAVHEKQNAIQQSQYVYNLNQQRRHRAHNIAISSLQQQLTQFTQTINNNNNNNNNNMTPQYLQQQQQQFMLLQQQQQSSYDENEKVEQAIQLHTEKSLEKELDDIATTQIEKVFACTQQHNIECKGVGGVHPPHNTMKETKPLHFKLIYPDNQPEVLFDSLLSNSLCDSMPSTRVFCEKCSTFTYQSSTRTLTTFPYQLNIMCAVQTDIQWEYWKRNDHRYKALVKRQLQQSTHGRTPAKPTNLFSRFNQAAGDNSNITAADHNNNVITPSSTVNNTAVSYPLTALEKQDSTDYHFLPHNVLIYLDRTSKRPLVFRILPSHALHLSTVINRLQVEVNNANQQIDILKQQNLNMQQNLQQLQQQNVQIQQQLFLLSRRMLQLQIQQQQPNMHPQKYHSLQSQLHSLNNQRMQQQQKQQQLMNHHMHLQQKLLHAQQILTQQQQQLAQHQQGVEKQIQQYLVNILQQATPSQYRVSVDTNTFAGLTVNDIAIYELSTVIAHIADPPEKDSPLHSINGEHLIAHIKVQKNVYDSAQPSSISSSSSSTSTPVADRNPHHHRNLVTSPTSPNTLPSQSEQEHDGHWYVFNDFVIRPSNGFEATTFKYIWKQPSAVIYRLMAPASSQEATQHLLPIHAQKAQHLLNNPFRNDQILYTPVPSLSLRYEQQYQVHTSFQSLSPNEIVDSNFLAAIDCEFVSVQPELTEFDEHGDTVVVRPARLTLARVSVTRGQGPMIGIPFIDDYIASSEPIVDYLTKYSGISPGDLDRSVSTHHLVTMKSAYIRLRSLVERGVHFVGHGLKKDFQMINIMVPPNQIVDTVELFSLPNQRKLGLKFLSKHLLNLDIQQSNHDSIEDARTALHLYHKYQELVQTGALQTVIHQLYQIGHRSGFKV